MQPCALVDVPEADREVHGSGYQVGRIVSRTLVVRIQEARNTSRVTGQDLIRQHVN